MRRFAGKGLADSNDNARDFVLVSADATTPGSDSSSIILGAPGPENLSSPIANGLDALRFNLSEPP